jgi:hypothetical protein
MEIRRMTALYACLVGRERGETELAEFTTGERSERGMNGGFHADGKQPVSVVRMPPPFVLRSLRSSVLTSVNPVISPPLSAHQCFKNHSKASRAIALGTVCGPLNSWYLTEYPALWRSDSICRLVRAIGRISSAVPWEI